MSKNKSIKNAFVQFHIQIGRFIRLHHYTWNLHVQFKIHHHHQIIVIIGVLDKYVWIIQSLPCFIIFAISFFYFKFSSSSSLLLFSNLLLYWNRIGWNVLCRKYFVVKYFYFIFIVHWVTLCMEIRKNVADILLPSLSI